MKEASERTSTHTTNAAIKVSPPDSQAVTFTEWTLTLKTVKILVYVYHFDFLLGTNLQSCASSGNLGRDDLRSESGPSGAALQSACPSAVSQLCLVVCAQCIKLAPFFSDFSVP